MADKYKIELNKRLDALLSNGASNSKFGGINVVKEAGQKAGKALTAEVINQAINNSPLRKYKGEAFKTDPKKKRRNPYGGFYFDTITLSGFEDGVNYTFPNDPLLNFDFGKNILETPLQGGDEVVEYIGSSPVELNLVGLLFDGTGIYPEEQLKELYRAFKENARLKIDSRLCNLYGIKEVVVKGLSVPKLEGYEDTQPFTLTLRSHKAIELIILENQ